MSTKHTPGPWEARDDDKVGGAGWFVFAHHAGVIALSTQPIDRAANARLIAAAPELLDVAMKVLHVAEDRGDWIHSPECDCDVCELLRMAHSALTKAGVPR